MIPTEIKETVRRWFVRAGQATGPILPDGWFGRPYDNIYLLQDIEVEDDLLTLRLTEDTALLFDRLKRAYVHNSELVFDDFAHLTFRWKNYGGTEYRERHYDSGQVRLLPPMGTTVTLDGHEYGGTSQETKM